MSTKIFAEHGNLKLTSDERDIMVPNKYRREVVNWCREMNIAAESALNTSDSKLTSYLFNVDIWRIRDPEHRAVFALKWLSI